MSASPITSFGMLASSSRPVDGEGARRHSRTTSGGTRRPWGRDVRGDDARVGGEGRRLAPPLLDLRPGVPEADRPVEDRARRGAVHGVDAEVALALEMVAAAGDGGLQGRLQ